MSATKPSLIKQAFEQTVVEVKSITEPQVPVTALTLVVPEISLIETSKVPFTVIAQPLNVVPVCGSPITKLQFIT